MGLPQVQIGQPHAAAHNAERDLLNTLEAQADYFQSELTGLSNSYSSLNNSLSLVKTSVNGLKTESSSTINSLTTLAARVSSLESNAGGGSNASNSAVHYAPATTTTNDTSALLAEMNAAKDQNKAFQASPDKVYTIDPLTVPSGLRIEGALRVKGRVPGQAYVLRLSNSAYDFTGTSLVVEGSGAIDGLQLFNAGRTRFGYLGMSGSIRCNLHLLQTNGSITTPNNNNQCSFGHIVSSGGGTKHNTTATVSSQSGNPGVINLGSTVLTLSKALPAWAVDVRVVDSGDETVLSSYLVIINGLAYRVKSVPSTTSIEIFNYPATSAGTALTVDILLGASVNVPMFRDNQAGYIANLDLISNPGLALNAGSAYGWTYAKSAYQGNAVGVNVQNFVQGAAWIGPYWELNTVDMVIGSRADASIVNPQWAHFNLQSLPDRLTSRGQMYHPGLNVIGSTAGEGSKVGPISADEIPSLNPGTLSLSPGYSYAFQRSVGTPTFRIAPKKSMLLYGANTIDVMIEAIGTWSGVVTFNMLTGGDYHADTVMGGSTYSTPTLGVGAHMFRLFRLKPSTPNGPSDWRVTYIG